MTEEKKEEEIANGFSAIEINGVTFHSVQEMLVYMNNLRKENAELNRDKTELTNTKTELKSKVTELEAQIEKMKSDVRINIKWADYEKNNQMWQKLIKMINEWS